MAFLTTDYKKSVVFFVYGTILAVLSDRKVHDYETAIEIRAIDISSVKGTKGPDLFKTRMGE